MARPEVQNRPEATSGSRPTPLGLGDPNVPQTRSENAPSRAADRTEPSAAGLDATSAPHPSRLDLVQGEGRVVEVDSSGGPRIGEAARPGGDGAGRTTGRSPDSSGRQHRRGRWRTAAVAAAALGVGIGATLWFTSQPDPVPEVTSRGAAAPERAVELDVEALADAGFVELPAPPSEIPVAPATDAVTAVEGFLAAEAADELETSYEFLSPAAQDAFGGSPAAWVAVHADVLPPVTGYLVDSTESTGDGTSAVTSTVGFEPSIDEVIGLVPAQAEVVWTVVETDGTFGVDIDASAFAPRYAPEADASDAVAAWVASRQRCEREGEWGGTLLGVQRPVRELCDADGQFTVGDPQPLGEMEAATFTAAFGDDALTWAREVPVTGPVELRAVVAPVGTQWRVIGALPPGVGGA